MLSKGGGIPRWILGLAVGIPMSLLTAYFLFGSSLSKEDEKKDASKKKSTKKKGSQGTKEKNLRVDPTLPLLEQAICYKDRGNEYFFQGRYELAVASYSEAISICPKNELRDSSIFYQNRAAAYEQLEKLDCVLSDCDMALSFDGNYVKALDRRSKVCVRLAEKDNISTETKLELLSKSLEDLTTLKVLNPIKCENMDFMLLLESVIKQIGTLEAQRTTLKPSQLTKFSVKEFFHNFIQDPCTSMSSQILNGNITNGHELRGFEKAMDAFDSEEFESIVRYCDEELEDPESPYRIQAKLLRATMNVISKDIEIAFQDLTDIIEEDDKLVDTAYKVNALIKRAYVRMYRNNEFRLDPSFVLDDFAKAQDLQQDNPDVYLHRGRHHLLMENIELALLDFERAEEVAPQSSMPLVQKSSTKFRKACQIGDMSAVKDCLNSFEEILRKHPTCAETHSMYAQALSEHQEFEKSISYFKKAQALRPQDAALLVQEALILIGGMNKVEEARSLMLKAMKVDDKCEAAYQTFALLEMRLGNYSKAEEYFDKAISLVGLNAELTYLFSQKYTCIAQAKVVQKLESQERFKHLMSR